MIDRYAWPGGEELVFATGAGHGPKLVVLAPLFEEANRTRRLLSGMMRRLAVEGVDCLLPDLPGTGDSVKVLADVTLENWRTALAGFAAALGGPFVTLAVRGGTLIDDVPGATGHLRLAPVEGAAILRDLFRARLAADREDGAAIDMAELDRRAVAAPIELAGNRLHPALVAGLRVAVPAAVAPLRTLRLESDPAGADAKLAAAPPWRRAEPGDDPTLAALLADEAARWIRACAG